MSMLDEINAVADAAPGFVWRLVDDGANDATTQRAQLGEATYMVNLSVWESREALWQYVYRSGHLDLLRQRADWFAKPDAPIVVLWWIPAGHVPTVDEALDRLAHLRAHGPGPEAFTFHHAHPAAG